MLSKHVCMKQSVTSAETWTELLSFGKSAEKGATLMPTCGERAHQGGSRGQRT